MLLRDAIEARSAGAGRPEEAAVQVTLPISLKKDRSLVRTSLLRRLAASRQLALGDRSGALKAAQGRSGRAFRVDVRQRVIVKALVCRHQGKGAVRGAALAKHVAYVARSGAGLDGKPAEYFNDAADGIDGALATAGWGGDRHHFRLIISPEHGDRISDLPGYVREVMSRVGADLGEPELTWLSACHYDTDQPHAHVLVRGRRADGRDLVIPRHYVGYGIRARAQEVAQERLGDLSRADAERRIWKETEADRFTGFDRRLLAVADAESTVEDGVGGSDAWAALTRGRLRHLERLGLATPVGKRYRLAADLEPQLRTLQVRRDIIRTLNQRRLEHGRPVKELGSDRVRGRVVRSGAHDELGASPFVFVRDGKGEEHYARLAFGQAAPAVGAAIELKPGHRGAQVLALTGHILDQSL